MANYIGMVFVFKALSEAQVDRAHAHTKSLYSKKQYQNYAYGNSRICIRTKPASMCMCPYLFFSSSAVSSIFSLLVAEAERHTVNTKKIDRESKEIVRFKLIHTR